MIVLLGVKLALRAAERARSSAGLDDRAQKLRVALRASRQETRGDRAEIGAIEVEPNAPAKRYEVGLREARVGAALTGDLTGCTGLHAGSE